MALKQGGPGVDILVGTNYADLILGDAGNDILKGFGGDDVITGGLGADTMIGGDGSDTYYVDNVDDNIIEGEAAGTDTVYASVDYVLSAGVERLYLTGNAHEGTGNAGANEIWGNGNDNVLVGLDGSDILNGGAGHDTLAGGDMNDILLGGDGDDMMNGGASVDVLTGEMGRDVLTGGTGLDFFVWNKANETGLTEGTADVITDFNIAEGDRINLATIDADVYAPGNQAFTFIGMAAFSGAPGEIRYYHSGGNTYIEMQTGTSVDVEGVIRLDGILDPEASWFIL
jgi:Ca2+-binding RTX toxin-like protein